MENLNYKDIYNYNVEKPVGAVTMYGTHECTRTVDQIRLFTNMEFGEVRAISIDDMAYLCYIDICTCMNLTNTHKERVTNFLDDDYEIINEGRDYYNQIELPYQYVTIPVDHGKFGVRNEKVLFISEVSFYKVAFKSTSPSARRFTDWVIRDILMPLRVQYGGSRPFIALGVKYLDEAMSNMWNNIQTTMENQSKEFKNIYEEQSDIQSANGGLWRDNMNLTNQLNQQQQFIDQKLNNMDKKIDIIGDAVYTIGCKVDSNMKVYNQMM